MMKNLISGIAILLFAGGIIKAADQPNVILIMADDMGWGQTGYRGHPVLKTPNLDAMAAAGLRFERFYAGAPNCSPTRATVMTGRTHDRGAVLNHGYSLHRQAKTIAQAMQKAGYATGHFGKWHLNGFSGPGAPIFANDTHNPGVFGFQTWLSVTNFFDRDPILSRNGKFEEFKGDSSEIIVDEAIKFIDQQAAAKKPFFTVIWYGSPHSPFVAGEADKVAFDGLNELSQNHYGELVAMDRSIGKLRESLKKGGLAQNTLVWFNSDNGGLPGVNPGTVGHLRNFKGSMYEGGLRVPGIIEWPAGIKTPKITETPACTVDIFPTIVDVVGLPEDSILKPVDGMSLKPLFGGDLMTRPKPLGFRHTGKGAWIDNDWKIVKPRIVGAKVELYNLKDDPSEKKDLASEHPEIAARMEKQLMEFSASVDRSQQGLDYPEGKVLPGEPGTRPWTGIPEYKALFDKWADRPEFRAAIQQARNPQPAKQNKKKAAD